MVHLEEPGAVWGARTMGRLAQAGLEAVESFTIITEPKRIDPRLYKPYARDHVPEDEKNGSTPLGHLLP